MRIVVFSDSHGITPAMEAAVEQQKSAKLFIHLGDGLEEFKRLMSKYPNKEYWCVRGNCDYSASEESTAYSWVKEVKIMIYKMTSQFNKQSVDMQKVHNDLCYINISLFLYIDHFSLIFIDINMYIRISIRSMHCSLRILRIALTSVYISV